MSFKAISFILMALLLCQCTSYDFSRRTVQQGNLLPDTKFERLKLGMSKQDAAILLGSSLVAPMFSADRWDYAYTLRVKNNAMQVRHLELWFKDNRVVRIEHRP